MGFWSKAMILKQRWGQSKLNRYWRRQRKKSWVVTWVLDLVVIKEPILVWILKELMLILILILMLMGGVGLSPGSQSSSLGGAFVATIGFIWVLHLPDWERNKTNRTTRDWYEAHEMRIQKNTEVITDREKEFGFFVSGSDIFWDTDMERRWRGLVGIEGLEGL